MRVLVTGACGWTARSILDALDAAGHRAVGVDLPGVSAPPEVPLAELHGVDVADLDALAPIAASCEAVVHLAVAVGARDYETPDRPFRTNVQGTWCVFEAARRGEVRGVVLIGSAPVHLPLAPERVDAENDRPSSPDELLYDVTKYLQEEIARQFCATHGMRAVALRAGHIVDGRAGRDPHGAPLSELTYCRGGWVCRHDLARAVVAALEDRGTGYEAFHVIGSRGARERFGVGRAEARLGFELKVDFAEY